MLGRIYNDASGRAIRSKRDCSVRLTLRINSERNGPGRVAYFCIGLTTSNRRSSQRVDGPARGARRDVTRDYSRASLKTGP